MATFTDAGGREWRLAVTVADLPALLECGFDLDRLAGAFQLADEAVQDDLARLVFGSPARRCAAAWALVRPQAETAGVSRGQFEAAFDGPTNRRATAAMLQATADFSPDGLLAAVLQDTPASALIGMMRRGSASTATAGSSPDSSASTPAP